jgi:hypothetical protein
LNKATTDVRELAVQFGPAAITELARLATKAVNEQTRITAIRELLDRAYGRPPQAVAVTSIEETAPSQEVSDLDRINAISFLLAKVEAQHGRAAILPALNRIKMLSEAPAVSILSEPRTEE